MKIDPKMLEGMKIPPVVSVAGIDYNLYKSVSDSSIHFAYEKLAWMNTGCEQICDQPSLYFCWIRGVISPAPNTLERPTDVMLVGFNGSHMNMSPQFMTMDHLKKMYIYKAETGVFAESFLTQFVGIPPVQEQPPMMDLKEVQRAAAK